ncbi:hypothetical protein KAH27_04005 [bacterium]|nr:hypothetical protein [bacterium]
MKSNLTTVSNFFSRACKSDNTGTAMSVKSVLSVWSVLVFATIAFADYSENFDVAGNWFGNTSSYDNPAYYTNNTAQHADDKFSSNYAERENTNYKSAPYAWRIATYSDSYFRYECQTTVSNFSLWLARESGFDLPDIKIRYSNNSGATWNNLYHGETFFNGISNLTYTQYVSPHLNVTPRPDKKIYIEVYKFSGARILVDDFSLNHKPIEINTVFLVYPAPAVTGIVAQVQEFYSDSYSNGIPQIGYGQTTNNVDWTWLSAGETNISGGYGATNSFWLMPGKWFYAARWIRDNGSVTNYAWNDHGQTNETSLISAQYFYLVTSSVHSVIWNFGYADDTSPTQGIGTLTFSPGVVSNIPGDGILSATNFPTSQSDKSKYLEFSASTIDKQSVGFYFSARRDENGPRYIDVQYSFDGNSWYDDFVTNYYLPSPDSWYMIGGSNNVFDLNNNISFRIIGYAATIENGRLEIEETQIHAAVPEPADLLLAGNLFFVSFLLKNKKNKFIIC